MMTTPPPELTCQELVALVSDYLEQSLPAPERARFDAHLAGCRGCRTYVEQMRQTIEALGTLTEDTIAPEAQQTLLDAFRHWKRQP